MREKETNDEKKSFVYYKTKFFSNEKKIQKSEFIAIMY